MSKKELEGVARRLFDSYGTGDLETMRSLLAEDLVSHSDEFWSA